MAQMIENNNKLHFDNHTMVSCSSVVQTSDMHYRVIMHGGGMRTVGLVNIQFVNQYLWDTKCSASFIQEIFAQKKGK